MILAYHEMSFEPLAYLYSVTCAQFDEQLQFVAGQNAKLAPPKPIGITFDDGHISQHEYAFPLLEQHFCQATFFVTAGWIDVRTTCMGWHHLRELVAHGHEVQSHGWSHAFLTTLPAADLKEELERSRKYLEDGLGGPIDAISVPGGRWNRRVIDACAAAGYKHVYVSTPWIAENRAETLLSGRLMVTKMTRADDLKRLLELNPAAVCMQRLRVRTIHLVRTILGDAQYHRLWCNMADWRGKA